jgi:hypothetical protein
MYYVDFSCTELGDESAEVADVPCGFILYRAWLYLRDLGSDKGASVQVLL